MKSQNQEPYITPPPTHSDSTYILTLEQQAAVKVFIFSSFCFFPSVFTAVISHSTLTASETVASRKNTDKWESYEIQLLICLAFLSTTHKGKWCVFSVFVEID